MKAAIYALARRHPFIVLFLGIACLIAIFELVGIHEIHDSCYPDCH
jgi:hypothetical protein